MKRLRTVKMTMIMMLALMTLVLCGCGEEPAAERLDDGKITIVLIDSGVSTTAIKAEHLLPGYNYVLKSEDTEDQINHGTAVASILLGCENAGVTAVSPDAYVVPLVTVTKVDGEIQSASPKSMAQAIRDAIDTYQADIINVSLGIREENEDLREAVAYAESKDVLLVSAVGNDGKDGRPYYPASYDTVLAVGSCDKHGEESYFSQEGADVLAPGENIMLASRNGIPYGSKGTSFATGYVTAYAANLLLGDSGLTAEAVRSRVVEEKIIRK